MSSTQSLHSIRSTSPMKRMHHRFPVRSSLRSLAVAAAAAAAFSLAGAAMAETELTLKSGITWRGDLNQTVEVTYVERGQTLTVQGKLVRADTSLVVVEGTFDGRQGKKAIFFGDVRDMKTLDTGEAAPANSAGAASADAGAAAPGKGEIGGDGEKEGVPSNFQGVFYLPLEGTVGVGTRAEEITAIGVEADKHGPGQIIVLEVISPGGLVIESVDIHKELDDLRRRHRVVAWIREAISAAAFTAFHCDEIYFMSVGAMGSMTMYAGTTAIQGETLAEWLRFAGEVAEGSGRDAQIARCMIKKEYELSYDIPPGGGPKDAIFRPDTKGQVVLDTADTMLTINASAALACGISDGTADTTDELAKLLRIPEWKEFNNVGRKLHEDWQRTLERGSEEIPKLVVLYDVKGTGSGDPVVVISGRIKTLEALIKWWDKCPECMIDIGRKGVGVPPKEFLEREIRRLKDQLAQIKRDRRGAGN